MKKILGVFLVFTLILMTVACSSSKTIEFNDPALEQKVRDAMDKPTGKITVSDAEKVTKLDFTNQFQQDMPDEIIIKDISALKYFVNLTELSLGLNNITDLSALAELKNLTLLQLYSNNSISDLSPLSSLANLSILHLQNNQIKDVSPLAGLKNLTSLLLTGNAITDYSPLKDIYPNLKEKDFDVISIEGVPDEPIVISDPNLESTLRRVLGISDRPITQKDAYQVQSLNIGHKIPSDEAISDLTGIEYFVNLKELYMDGNNLSDLSPIKGLTKLKVLTFSFNKVADISALAGMTQLEEIDAKVNKISDLSPIKGLTSIWDLQINSNQIADVSPLAGFKNLKILLLAENPVSDFSLFKDIYPNLEGKDFEVK